MQVVGQIRFAVSDSLVDLLLSEIVRHDEDRSAEVRLAEVCLAEVRLDEVRPSELRLLEERPAEVCPAEVCSLQIKMVCVCFVFDISSTENRQDSLNIGTRSFRPLFILTRFLLIA